ncbi:MAG: tetratricopeptide repeat protein [Bacteroidota bacterium]
MHRILILSAIVLLFVTACGPLVELEDENIALRSRVDSLEINLAECRGQGDLLQERLAAIETENLQLDDRNRELSARVVEVQYEDDESSATGTVVPAENNDESPAASPDAAAVQSEAGESSAGSDEPVASTAAVPAAVNAAAAMPTPRYNGSVPTDLEFLRQYQAALNAYNDKNYAESVRLFTALLAGSSANDMTDNCVYWMGEAAVQQGQPARAIELFTTVIGYHGADKVDDALISRAAVYAREKNVSAARADLDRLLREFPGSEHIGIARQMLRNLR